MSGRYAQYESAYLSARQEAELPLPYLPQRQRHAGARCPLGSRHYIPSIQIHFRNWFDQISTAS